MEVRAPETFSDFSCRNSDDPFTLDSLEDIDPKRIINIEGDCFDLKPLFNWVYNERKFTNPLTNLRFSRSQLNLIRDAALQNFPTKVVIKVKGDVLSFMTSSLASWERIFINSMVNVFKDPKIDTLYEAIKYNYKEKAQILVEGNEYTNYLGNFIFENIEGEMTSEEELDIKPPEIVLIFSMLSFQKYLDGMKRVLRLKGYPTDWIKDLPKKTEKVKYAVSIQFGGSNKEIYTEISMATFIFTEGGWNVRKMLKAFLIDIFSKLKPTISTEKLREIVNYKIALPDNRGLTLNSLASFLKSSNSGMIKIIIYNRRSAYLDHFLISNIVTPADVGISSDNNNNAQPQEPAAPEYSSIPNREFFGFDM